MSFYCSSLVGDPVFEHPLATSTRSCLSPFVDHDFLGTMFSSRRRKLYSSAWSDLWSLLLVVLCYCRLGLLLHVLQSRWRSLLVVCAVNSLLFSIAHYDACCIWIWQTKQLISAPWSYVLCFYYIFVALLYLGSGMQHHCWCHCQSLYTDIIPYTTHHLTSDDLHKSAKHTSEINPDGISKHPWPSWVSWWVLCNFRNLNSLPYSSVFCTRQMYIENVRRVQDTEEKWTMRKPMKN